MSAEATTTFDVCALDELKPGVVRPVELPGGERIGVVRVGDAVHGFGLRCPHRGGPLEYGSIRQGLSSDAPGERALHAETPVLACPWHNWEFSLETGCALFDPRRHIRTMPCAVSDDRVVLHLDAEEDER